MNRIEKMKSGWLMLRTLLLFVFIYLIYAFLLEFIVEITNLSLNGIWQLILEQLKALLILLVTYFSLKKLHVFTLADIGFSTTGRAKEMAGGFLTALLLFGTGFAVSWAAGWIHVETVQGPWASLLTTWILFFLVAVYEEALVRGIILGHMLHQGISRFTALLLSAVLFSCLHLFNPNFSWLPFINLILAGILLGASYIYTHNLWFPIFLHWFWNWLQGPVLGYGVSGMKLGESAITLSYSGPEMLSGKDFGFEGTILCTILMIITTIFILRFFKAKSTTRLK